MYCDITVFVTLLPPSLDGSMRLAARPTSPVISAPSQKQLLGLKNARWVSVHKVDVRMRLGKVAPFGRLQKSCNAVVRCASFNRCPIGGILSSPKCVMKSKYFPLHPCSDLMHIA
jgi:hypothetical protein